MYLSPLSVKTKHARVGSFTTCLGCPRFRERKCALSHSEHIQHRQFYNISRLSKRSQNIEEGPSNRLIALGRGTVDVSGVDKIFKFIATIPLCSTLYLYGTDKEIYAKQKVNNFRL